MSTGPCSVSVEPLAKATKPVPLEPPYHQGIVLHRRRQLEKFVQFRIVLVGRTLESSADDELFRIVECPHRTLEVQHRLLPLGDHEYRLAAPHGE